MGLETGGSQLNPYEALKHHMRDRFEQADQLTRTDPIILAAAIRWLDAVGCQNFTAAQSWVKSTDPVEFRRALQHLQFAKITQSVVHLPIEDRIPSLMANGYYDGLSEREAAELDKFVRTMEETH